MDGPRPRPLSHDEPLPQADASAPRRRRPQLWRLSDVCLYLPHLLCVLALTNPASINLSLTHPRLLTSIILLDPVIQLSPPNMGLGTDPPGNLNSSTYRRDLWPNRRAAAATFAKSPILASWDPRVLSLMVTYGLRDLPTELYPSLPADNNPNDPYVTLTSTKHQEVWTTIRPNYHSRDPATGRIRIDRSTHADIDPLAAFIPLYRPEPRSTFYRLPTVRPSVLWLLGEKTIMRLDEINEGIKVCGTGVGGSGGAVDGRVQQKVMLGHGHLFPMEIVAETAEACATWLGTEMERFRKDEERWRAERAARSEKDDLMTDEAWRTVVKPLSAFAKPPMKAKAKADTKL